MQLSSFNSVLAFDMSFVCWSSSEFSLSNFYPKCDTIRNWFISNCHMNLFFNSIQYLLHCKCRWCFLYCHSAFCFLSAHIYCLACAPLLLFYFVCSSKIYLQFWICFQTKFRFLKTWLGHHHFIVCPCLVLWISVQEDRSNSNKQNILRETRFAVELCTTKLFLQLTWLSKTHEKSGLTEPSPLFSDSKTWARKWHFQVRNSQWRTMKCL